MVFSSLVFLFAYLPLTLLIYYVTPRKWRNLFLFFINLLFYGWGEPMLVLLMVFNVAFNYLGGWLVDKYRHDRKKKKLFLILTIVLDVGILAVFKYTGLIVETLNHLPFMSLPDLKISLPIGISFYTFQTMSYVIDVYRDDAPVSKSFINFGTYLALFPQLIAGPIVRYRDVAEQMIHRRETLAMFTKGVKIFCVGLAKKVLIANQMGALTSALLADENNGILGVWVGIIGFSFQLYFDFSGYSDMACGLGNMLGFEFLKNFNYPYIATSITDFWRRWHISLSTWFRDYVYIPLGGSRVKFGRWAFNILVVFVLSGIWHGAAWTFLLWGFAHGLLHIVEKALRDKLPSKEPKSKWLKISIDALCVVKTFVLVTLFWVMFRATDLEHLKAIFVTAFTNFDGGEQMSVKPGMWIYLGVLILFDVLLRNTRFDAWCGGKPLALRWLIYAVLVFMVICCSSVYNFPFIYFQF